MSHEEENLTPGERELETALGRLKPSPAMFTLQHARARALLGAQRRHTRIWQGIAAVLAIAAGAAIWMRPEPRTVEVEKIVIRDVPVQVRFDATDPPAPQPLILVNGDFAYLKLRDKALARGMNSLRAARETPGATKSPSIISESRDARGAEVQMPWYVDYIVSGGRS